MKKRHGHHGGSWKVAYADFVTAMMALFLVLWLLAQDQKIKEVIERAFRHPFTSLTQNSIGIIPNKDLQAVKSREGPAAAASLVELNMLRKLNEDLLRSLKTAIEDQNTVELAMTPDEMRISIFDRSQKPVFEPDSARFTPYGNWVISTLAWSISRYQVLLIELDGHTEYGHALPADNYDHWELTSDRANAARRKLILHGVQAAQIRKVAGYADTKPIPGVQPEDEKNRRVTVLLRLRPETSS